MKPSDDKITLKILRLYDSGFTLNEISKITQYPVPRVTSLLKKYLKFEQEELSNEH